MSGSTAVGAGLEGLAAPCLECRAVVVVPARNEEAGLAATLDALRMQVGLDGRSLRWESYEVLLLLNNCTDRSAAVAEKYTVDHEGFQLHVLECELAAEVAHVGTARRRLMDLACERLDSLGAEGSAILSTDADTLVAEDWIAANLAAIGAGAEVVGGAIELLTEDFQGLGPGLRLAYERDGAYQGLVARLEAMLDPDPADPWPRHLQHFGASLACTPAIYRRCGGLPAVKPLEDVAFVDALRKVGARIRHAPEVRIFTSARLDGRAEVGLSGQLRHWQDEGERGLPQIVDSAEWLEHRFKTLASLRRLDLADLRAYPEQWRERLARLGAEKLPVPRFLELLDCNGLIEEMFRELPGEPRRRGEICEVMMRLREMVASRSQIARRGTG
jgi:hypothetical protein